MEGIISGFTPRKPTREEYQDQVSFPRLKLTSYEPWKPTSDNFFVEEQRCVSSIRHLDQVIDEGELAVDNLHRHVDSEKSYHYSRAAIEFKDGIYNVLCGSHTTAPCEIGGNGLQGQDDEQIYPKWDNSLRIHGLSTV